MWFLINSTSKLDINSHIYQVCNFQQLPIHNLYHGHFLLLYHCIDMRNKRNLQQIFHPMGVVDCILQWPNCNMDPKYCKP